MHKEIEMLNLPGQQELRKVIKYTREDLYELNQIYNIWKSLNLNVQKIGGRRVQIPSEIIEGIVAIYFNYWKVEGTDHNYFDLYDPIGGLYNNRIEVKYTTTNVNRIIIGNINCIDKICVVRLYVDVNTTLQFEIFEYNIKSLLERFNTGTTRGIHLDQNYQVKRMYLNHDFIENNQCQRFYNGFL